MSKRRELENDILSMQARIKINENKLEELNYEKEYIGSLAYGFIFSSTMDAEINNLSKKQSDLQAKLEKFEKELLLIEQCKNCGYIAKDEKFKFCPICGKKFDEIKEDD